VREEDKMGYMVKCPNCGKETNSDEYLDLAKAKCPQCEVVSDLSAQGPEEARQKRIKIEEPAHPIPEAGHLPSTPSTPKGEDNDKKAAKK
jgi:phage FluMu protein Com